MCMSTPDVPDPGPPPQEPKTPEVNGARKKKAAGAIAPGGSILTSANGLSQNTSNTGGNTALGS